MGRAPKHYPAGGEARRERKRTPRVTEKEHLASGPDGETALRRVVVTTPEEIEARQFVATLARNFAASIEWYKNDYGGNLSHAEAVEAEEGAQEWRLARIREGKDPKEITWSDLSAVSLQSVTDALELWAKICDTADDALACGLRAGAIIGDSSPYERAQFLAVRDAFADQWKPQGGIEAAMIDMLAVAFSLQMYWSAIAHDRATRTHDEQKKTLRRFETAGWKSPYQSEADAVEQAHRLADGYNRQFLRVLRQMRDLRRYAPPVIINQAGGQVNVGQQQVNVSAKVEMNSA